jgi:hypothetical protein
MQLPSTQSRVCRKLVFGGPKVLGLKSVKDAEGKIIQESPLSLWANFCQRSLDVAILGDQQEDGPEDRNRVAGAIKHRRVTSVIFAIEEQGGAGR